VTTEKLAAPPDPGEAPATGLRAYVHGPALPVACETVCVWPFTLIVAVRAAPVFESTVYATVPAPVPVAFVTCTQAATVDAVHPHVAPVVTENDEAPPAAAIVPLEVGDKV
jgi:hypothetical protein